MPERDPGPTPPSNGRRMESRVNDPKNNSRREFLSRSIAGLSLAALPTWYAREAVAAEADRASAQQRRVAANDRINVACIGTGGSKGGFRQGLGDTHGMARQPGVKVVAV